MGVTTRFPKGVTNVAKNNTLGMMGQLDPSKFHTYFSDFDTYAAADWTVTETGTTTQALTAGDGGLLLVTNSAADNDATFMQLSVASFLMEANKKAFFKIRFKVSDATQSDVQVGLVITDATPLDATDGIFFQKDDGDTHLDFYCQKDGSTGQITTIDIGELADDTYIDLGWYYDGSDAVDAYINDVKVASLDASSTYLPDATLAVSFGIQNGEAVAKTMTVDYVLAAKER